MRTPRSRHLLTGISALSCSNWSIESTGRLFVILLRRWSESGLGLHFQWESSPQHFLLTLSNAVLCFYPFAARQSAFSHKHCILPLCITNDINFTEIVGKWSNNGLPGPSHWYYQYVHLQTLQYHEGGNKKIQQ